MNCKTCRFWREKEQDGNCTRMNYEVTGAEFSCSLWEKKQPVTLKIIVGPQGCGKTKWCEKIQSRVLTGTSGSERLNRIEAILSHEWTVPIVLDDVDAFLDVDSMEKLIDILTAYKGPLYVTARNPMFFNFLPDDIAIESMFYLKDGDIFPYFESKDMFEKLELMGAGEAFCDTDWNRFYN